MEGGADGVEPSRRRTDDMDLHSFFGSSEFDLSNTYFLSFKKRVYFTDLTNPRQTITRAQCPAINFHTFWIGDEKHGNYNYTEGVNVLVIGFLRSAISLCSEFTTNCFVLFNCVFYRATLSAFK